MSKQSLNVEPLAAVVTETVVEEVHALERQVDVRGDLVLANADFGFQVLHSVTLKRSGSS